MHVVEKDNYNNIELQERLYAYMSHIEIHLINYMSKLNVICYREKSCVI